MLLINRYRNPKQNIRKMNSVMYEKRLYMIKESWSQESKDSFTLKNTLRTSLAVQWLRLWASTAGGTGSIPCQELWSHMSWGMDHWTTSTRTSGLSWWLGNKEPICNTGDTVSIPGSGRSPGEGNDNPLHYSCLRNPMDRGAWWAIVHGVARVRHDGN